MQLSNNRDKEEVQIGFMKLLYQETSLEKKQLGKRLTDSRVQIKIKDILRPFLSLLSKTRVHYKVIIENRCNLIPNHSVIYAANHFSFMDTPIICRSIPKRGYIFSGKQRLGFSDWLYFVLNGVIFVDRKSKEDMAASKETVISYLNKNCSIIMFPEGTWNLTDNALMMPMKWGIIDIAKEANAQIVPVILDYNRVEKICCVHFCEPLLFENEIDKAVEINRLRDIMSTVRFSYFERRKASRKDMDIEAEKREQQYSIKEFPSIEWEYEISCVYCPYSKSKDVFEHLKNIQPTMQNAFLFNKRLK